MNTNERSTRLSFLCNSFLVLHPIYWYCTYYIPVNIKKILCRRTLPILKFFASVSFWIFSQLIYLKIEHHCTTHERKKKNGFERLCINCQQFWCLSLSWCKFSTRFCQLEEFFCGRSSQCKIVGKRRTALWAQNHAHFCTMLHFLFEKFFLLLLTFME